MLIRRASPGDERRLRDLRLRALREAPEAFATTYELDAARSDADWAQLLADPEAAIFVAIDGASWAGMAAGNWYDRERRIMRLWGMWVDPAYRRGGLGARLVDAVHGWAREHGATQVRLGVIDGLRLQDFYRRLGFEPTGETMPLPRDESRLAVFLARPL